MTKDEIVELIEGYLDGTADNDRVAQLRAWLEEDSSNVQYFAREVFFHQQLRETLVAANTAHILAADDEVAVGRRTAGR